MSTTFAGCPSGNAVADVLGDADAGTVVLPALAAAMGSVGVVCAAAGAAAVFGNTAADGAGIGAVGVVREEARAEISGLSLDGTAATEAGGKAAFAGAVVGPVTIAGAAVGATDATAGVRTLVTIARAPTGVFSGSLGRSTSESTTPAPVVAPIAVATKTTRAVRAKLGAGAK